MHHKMMIGHRATSGQVRLVTSTIEQRLFEPRGSINRCWSAWGSLSWHFDILDIFVSLSKHPLSSPSLIHHHSEIGVIPSVFA